ncbi:glycine N-acyltransferase-like protein 3 [Lacerta agilis]|uniref:glycine N-acyltransferase-like protein 3 n=1 Tax=Lacerta agilis TaxID=80427 RepID=UPI00141966D0|nr:glycine N-acyltransferase-like protein 3 [Lacerta agilis]
MQILTCPSKLKLLETVLQRHLPQALPAYGAVMHINRRNPAQHEVVVDSWPEFKVVLTRPRQEVVEDKQDYYANFHTAFYLDVDAWRTLLENAEAIDWGKAFQLQGLQDGLFEAARDITESRRVDLKPYLYQTFLHPDPSAYCQSRYRSGLFHLGSLNPSHSALLNENWSVGRNDWSLRYLDSLIRNFPSACLLDKEGQLVSWCLTDPMGCLLHGYTLPQYRGQGCVAAVTRATAVKLHACGFPLYGGVSADNQPSKQTLKRQGFHILPLTKYMLLFTPSLQPTR